MGRSPARAHTGQAARVAELSALPGLGPVSTARLVEAGLCSADELMNGDAVEIFRRVKAGWPQASLNLLYALVGAQEGRHWREIARERRLELLMRLEDAQASGADARNPQALPSALRKSV